MKIAVLGTGTVGDTIGSRLIELGHEVKMGSRTADNEKAKGFVLKNGQKAGAGTFADAAAFGEIIFNCTAGVASVEALKMAAEHLNGKIVIDVANPLDFSKGMPPCLVPELSNTHSLGEEIQKNFPAAKVVKTLNTMWCGIMVNPAMIGGGDHTNFICGNDDKAKEQVKSLLKEFGWKDENLLDLGGIACSRGTEAVLPVWLRIWNATKNGAFNIKVVN
jgi:predicted dinucleotide-binding enzyme